MSPVPRSQGLLGDRAPSLASFKSVALVRVHDAVQQEGEYELRRRSERYPS